MELLEEQSGRLTIRDVADGEFGYDTDQCVRKCATGSI